MYVYSVLCHSYKLLYCGVDRLGWRSFISSIIFLLPSTWPQLRLLLSTTTTTNTTSTTQLILILFLFFLSLVFDLPWLEDLISGSIHHIASHGQPNWLLVRIIPPGGQISEQSTLTWTFLCRINVNDPSLISLVNKLQDVFSTVGVCGSASPSFIVALSLFLFTLPPPPPASWPHTD